MSILKASLGLPSKHDKWEKWSGKVESNSIRSARSDEYVSAMLYPEVS